MRTPLYTRALLAVVAVLVLAGFRSSSLGTVEERVAASPTPVAASAEVPAAPDDHRAAVEASRADPVQTQAQNLIWPAPGQITSPFGDRRNHPGIDIDGVTGDPVQAAGAGTVVAAGPAATGFGGYGNIVVIDNGGGISTVYAHLSRVDVAVGQLVEQGQQLGAIGNTGASTGDHLHFEVRVLDKPVDPMPYLPPRP